MNPNLADIAPSLIRGMNARKRPGDIDLGLGEPTLPPDLDAFAEALEWTRRHGSPYSPNAGFPELREAVARYLAGADPWAMGPLGPENVCVTVGSEEALYAAIKTVVDPARDEVLIVEPCYLAYLKICVLEGIAHRTVSLNPADGFRPRADAVLEAISPRTRLVVLNSPCNPTARVWPEAELRALAAGLAERERSGREIYVLSDEVYRELYYDDVPPASVARFHPHTLVAGSLSKSNALTGLRLGWLAGPRAVIANAIKVHQYVNTAASTFSQRVALYLLADPSRLAAHRPVYIEARRRLLEAASAASLPILPPEGTFYTMLELPPDRAGDSLAAAEALLDAHRVVTVPGRAFGSAAEGWLRLSWVAPHETVAEGIRRIAEWFES